MWPAAAIVLLFALQVWAFRWGVVTPDTVFQWGQALSGRYDDWHPPATTWLWRQLMRLGQGTASVLVFDCALYWSGVALFAGTLARRGSRWGVAGVLLVAASPIAFGQMGAILKDPLLAACCLVAAGLAFATDGRGATLARIAAVALLVFATAVRINAVFATVPLLVALLPGSWTRGPLRLAAALLGSAVLLLAGSWAIDTAALRPHRSQPIFSLVNFDLAGIVAQGGVSGYPHTPAARVRQAAACYHPAQFNPTYDEDCDTVEEELRARATAASATPMTIWTRTIAAAPLPYLAHRIGHLNWNWRFMVGCVPDDAVYVMTTPNRFGIGFAPSRATMAVYRAARWMARSPLGRPATWLAVAAGLLLLVAALPSGRTVAALALSALCYGGGYAVVSVAPDLRYNFWTMLAAAVALVVALSELPGLTVGRGRLLLAAMPAVIVVGAELLALSPGCVPL